MATHYVSRELIGLGHDVKQVPPAYAMAFRQGHKNDFRDAYAIAEAVQRPSTRFVPVKTDGQLDLQAGQRSGPVAVYENERPRSGWAEILLLAERLAAEPSLIPTDPFERALVFGLAHRFIDFAHRTAAVDDECARFNDAALAGDHRRLLGVELTARKLESFSGYEPSIIEAVKLPDWTNSGRLAWPLPKIPLSVAVAQAMAPPCDARFGANWAGAREQDMARRAETEARWAKEEEARQAESRRAYEATLRR